MHQVDEAGEDLGVGLGRDAVAEVDDVARGGGAAAEHVEGVLLEGLPAGQQPGRVDVALERDAGQAGGFDPPFPNHAIMHGAGKFGLASLANLDQLPPTGAVVIAAPLKIVGGSGSPVRVLAIVPA